MNRSLILNKVSLFHDLTHVWTVTNAFLIGPLIDFYSVSSTAQYVALVVEELARQNSYIFTI